MGRNDDDDDEMSVQEYLEKHDLSKRVEEALNAAVKAKAEEPLAFVTEYMKKRTSSAITKVVGRQIFDSRGNPTVEADVYTHKGMFRAMVPSGASTGIYDAVELRDGGKEYMGKGVAQPSRTSTRSSPRRSWVRIRATKKPSMISCARNLTVPTTRVSSAPTPCSRSPWPSPRLVPPRRMCRFTNTSPISRVTAS